MIHTSLALFSQELAVTLTKKLSPYPIEKAICYHLKCHLVNVVYGKNWGTFWESQIRKYTLQVIAYFLYISAGDTGKHVRYT